MIEWIDLSRRVVLGLMCQVAGCPFGYFWLTARLAAY